MKHLLKSYTFIITILAFFIATLAISIYFYKNLYQSTHHTSAPQKYAASHTQQETTCAIIKPEAVAKQYTGDIIKLIELNKFVIKHLLKMHLSHEQAAQFYAVHQEKPFFKDLVKSMTSGPVVILMLEKEHAVHDWRELMGATDPKKAAPGTLRYMFGSDVTNNAVHGSDAAKTAQQELSFFFTY